MLERIKNNLEEFELNNILETELKEKMKILQQKRNKARKTLKEVNESELDYDDQKCLK